MIWCASHCFPVEKAGRQDFTHMIARPLINKDIHNRQAVARKHEREAQKIHNSKVVIHLFNLKEMLLVKFQATSNNIFLLNFED